MKRLAKRLLSTIAALTVAVTAMALPASAADYAPIKGAGEIPVTKEWVWPNLSDVPGVLFQIVVSPDPNPDEGELSGVLMSGSSPSNTWQTPINMENSVIVGDHAEVTTKIKMNSFKFSEPGIHSYILYEMDRVSGYDSDTDKVNALDMEWDTSQYKLKISVGVNSAGDSLEFKGIWVEDSNGEKVENLVFRNVSKEKEPEPTADLTVTNTVAGEDTSGDFSFTIDNLKGAEGEYTVTTPAGDKKITVASDGTVTGDSIALKHGESFVVKSLPVGTQYSVTESDPGENYVVTIGGTNALTATGELAAEGTTVEFLNTLQQAPPTGIVLDMLPFALLAAMIGGGLVLLSKKRRT